MQTYDEVMKGVKETTKFPEAIAGTKGLLSRPEAEWLVRIPRVLGPGHYAELGTFQGRSACLLAETIKTMPGSWITTVGLFNQKLIRHKYRFKGENLYAHVCALLREKGLNECIDVIRADTAEAYVHVLPNDLVFLFIDADHSYEGVRRDFNAWESRLKREGIVAFHDSHLETVSRFLHELVDWEEFDRVDTLSVWRRK